MCRDLTSHLHYLVLSSVLLMVGCEEQYYDLDDFQEVKKIDVHTHTNIDNPILIEQAIEDNFRLLTLNVDVDSYPSVLKQKEVASGLKRNYPGLIGYATAFTLDEWDNRELWLERTISYLDETLADGAVGVKVWKNIGMAARDKDGDFILIDDPQFDPVFNYLVSRGVPLLGHIGEPKDAWLPFEEMINSGQYWRNNPQYHMYHHPEYPSYEEIIEARDNMLNKHPDLKYVGIHLGSMEWDLEMMADHLDKYPNVSFDLAARVSYIKHHVQRDREKVRDFFIKYQDRLLYSTDLALNEGTDIDAFKKNAHDIWRSDWEFFVTDNSLPASGKISSINGLKLSKAVIDKLYHKNAEKLFPEF